jgi:hypothetical protein
MALDYTALTPDTWGNGFLCKTYSYTTLDVMAAVSAVGYFNKVATRLGIGDMIAVSVVDAIPPASRTTRVDTSLLTVDTIIAGVVTTSVFSTSNINAPVSTAQAAADALVASNAATATALKADAVATTAALAGKQATLTAGQLPGTATNDSATAGNVGEYIESVIASGSAVSLVNATAKTITSVSLPAGDWDVDVTLYFLFPASTSVTQMIASISGTTNVLDTTAGKFSGISMAAFVPGAASSISSNIVPYRLSLSGTTSVFLIAQAAFSVSTLTAYGIIRARRAR